MAGGLGQLSSDILQSMVVSDVTPDLKLVLKRLSEQSGGLRRWQIGVAGRVVGWIVC